jgi:hypothetical protein
MKNVIIIALALLCSASAFAEEFEYPIPQPMPLYLENLVNRYINSSDDDRRELFQIFWSRAALAQATANSMLPRVDGAMTEVWTNISGTGLFEHYWLTERNAEDVIDYYENHYIHFLCTHGSSRVMLSIYQGAMVHFVEIIKSKNMNEYVSFYVTDSVCENRGYW